MKEEQQRAELIFKLLKSMTPYESGFDRSHLLNTLNEKNEREKLMLAKKSNRMRKSSMESNGSSESNRQQNNDINKKLKSPKKVSFGDQILVNNACPPSGILSNPLFFQHKAERTEVPQRSESQMIQKDLLNLQSSTFSKFKIPLPQQSYQLSSSRKATISNPGVAKFISPSSQFVNLINSSRTQALESQYLKNSSNIDSNRTTISRFASESMLMRYRHIEDEEKLLKKQQSSQSMLGQSLMAKSSILSQTKTIKNPESTEKMEISTFTSKSKTFEKRQPMRSSSLRSLSTNKKIEKQKFNLEMQIFKRKLDSKFKFK